MYSLFYKKKMQNDQRLAFTTSGYCLHLDKSKKGITMENEKKDLLMQYLHRFTMHYGVEGANLVSFKKREDLLEKLKQKSPPAWQVMKQLIEAFIKSERIRSDREKFDRARLLWDTEMAAAEHEKVTAEMQLVQFCKAESIAVGGIAVAQ